MKLEQQGINKRYRVWIWILSIVIPVVVAILFNAKIPGVVRLGFLPPIYATINGITSILLILAVFQIKKGNRNTHKRLMKTAIVLSILFLLMYIVYHMTSEATKYEGEGILKYVYFIVLITHIILSIVVIPLVLITYFRAITDQTEKHRKIARIAFPLWLYVTISGVIVYILDLTLLLMKLKMVIFLLILLLVSISADAQCAMCRAVLESDDSGQAAKGINNGIIYLMIFPYLFITGVGYAIYRSRKKRKETE